MRKGDCSERGSGAASEATELSHAFGIDCLEWYRIAFPGDTEATNGRFAVTTEVFHFVSIDLVDPGMGSEVALFGDRYSDFWCPLFGTGAWTARCELAARLGIAAE